MAASRGSRCASGDHSGQPDSGTFQADVIPQFRQRSRSSLFCPYLTFPNHQLMPAFPLQLFSNRDVPLLVGVDLGTPVVKSGFRKFSSWTILVAVPETAVNKYRQLVATYGYVRSSWYVRGIHPVSHTLRPQVTAHKHFGACVLAMHGGHYLATFFLTSCIHLKGSYGTPLNTYGEYL